MLYRTVDTGCTPSNYTVVSRSYKVAEGMKETVFADADWKLMFVIKSGNKVKLLDAKARVLKWYKQDGCYYLTAFGGTNLPLLESDLAKLIGPWVSLVFKTQKLHTNLVILQEQFQIATVIQTITSYVSNPCGHKHKKKVIWPIPTPVPPIKGSGYAGTSPGAQGGAEYVKPTDEVPLTGYEFGPWPVIPSGPPRYYTMFQPPTGKELYTPPGVTPGPWNNMDSKVQALIDAGNAVTVVRAPEHDQDYIRSLPHGGYLISQTGSNVATSAQAYQVSAMSYAWMTNSQFVQPASDEPKGKYGSGSYNSGGYY